MLCEAVNPCLLEKKKTNQKRVQQAAKIIMPPVGVELSCLLTLGKEEKGDKVRIFTLFPVLGGILERWSNA